MKILYSCLSRSWGGMEMFTITSIKQLLTRKHQVELVCYPESKIAIEANNLNIIIHYIKARSYFHPIQTLKLKSIIENGKFDLIHTQASKDLWVLVPALKLLKSKTPLVLTKQVGSFVVKKDFLHKKIYERVNKVFAISNIIKENLIETCPIDENKIELVWNGVDTHKFSPSMYNKNNFRNEIGVKENEILIGMLARFSQGKGHEEFIKAASNLMKKYSNLKFVIVGEASRGEEHYEKEIRNLASEKCNEKIIFTGFRSDTANVLAGLDIFAFPSHSEALGIALIEALSMGVPAVATRRDGILDIMEEGVTGFMFERKNAKDLEEKMEYLIINAELRKKISVTARERMKRLFDLEILTDKTISIYNQLVNKNG